MHLSTAQRKSEEKTWLLFLLSVQLNLQTCWQQGTVNRLTKLEIARNTASRLLLTLHTDQSFFARSLPEMLFSQPKFKGKGCKIALIHSTMQNRKINLSQAGGPMPGLLWILATGFNPHYAQMKREVSI